MALNGRRIDTAPTESELDEQYGLGEGGEDDVEMVGDESAEARRIRYMNSEQGEVSDPDEWASLHHGHWDADQHSRMVDYANDNLQRLINARETLRNRYNNAAIHGNWEEAANYSRAIEEVEAFMDIA